MVVASNLYSHSKAAGQRPASGVAQCKRMELQLLPMQVTCVQRTADKTNGTCPQSDGRFRTVVIRIGKLESLEYMWILYKIYIYIIIQANTSRRLHQIQTEKAATMKTSLRQMLGLNCSCESAGCDPSSRHQRPRIDSKQWPFSIHCFSTHVRSLAYGETLLLWAQCCTIHVVANLNPLCRKNDFDLSLGT